MRRTIGLSNPFHDLPRFAFGYEFIAPGMRLLDYGCFEGYFGRELQKHKAIDYVGVDKNADAVRADADVKIVIIKDRLPFEDASFDAVTAFEVLEHIHDQDRVVRELWRVLKVGGLLLVSVPRRHLFTFLDFGNLKFVFPRTHRLFYTLKYSSEAYRYRYVDNPYGLVGDIEKGKSWHQHFRDQEMRDLLERCGFEIIEMDGAGLLSAVFDALEYVPLVSRLFTQRVRNWDSYKFHSRSLVCAARKV